MNDNCLNRFGIKKKSDGRKRTDKMKNDIYSLLFIIGYFKMFEILSHSIPKSLILIISLIISIILYYKEIISGMKNFTKNNANESLSIVTVLIILTSILSLLWNQWQINTNENKDPILYLLFTSFIFAPFVEEIFRRIAINSIIRNVTNNVYAINIVSALLFSFLHLYKINCDSNSYFYYGIIYALLGYACSHYYEKNQNYISAWSIHFMWNSFMIIGMMIRFLLSYFLL